MRLLLGILLLLCALSGTLVVLSRDPRRQVFMITASGLALTLLFFAPQAPDVASSELAVGTASTPLLVLTALAAVRIHGNERPKRRDGKLGASRRPFLRK